MRNDPKHLRDRIRWLRHRESELLSRVNGPRYPEPVVDVHRFIGHIGDWDAYIVDEYMPTASIWLIQKVERQVVAIDCVQEKPELYPLQVAALQIMKDNAMEVMLCG